MSDRKRRRLDDDTDASSLALAPGPGGSPHGGYGSDGVQSSSNDGGGSGSSWPFLAGAAAAGEGLAGSGGKASPVPSNCSSKLTGPDEIGIVPPSSVTRILDLVTRHSQLRSELLALHARELSAFESQCEKELQRVRSGERVDGSSVSITSIRSSSYPGGGGGGEEQFNPGALTRESLRLGAKDLPPQSPMSSSFLSVPEELVLGICEYLTTTDLAGSMAVSRSWLRTHGGALRLRHDRMLSRLPAVDWMDERCDGCCRAGLRWRFRPTLLQIPRALRLLERDLGEVEVEVFIKASNNKVIYFRLCQGRSSDSGLLDAGSQPVLCDVLVGDLHQAYRYIEGAPIGQYCFVANLGGEGCKRLMHLDAPLIYYATGPSIELEVVCHLGVMSPCFRSSLTKYKQTKKYRGIISPHSDEEYPLCGNFRIIRRGLDITGAIR